MYVRTSPAQSTRHQVGSADDLSEQMICRAIGEELRRTREMQGWSRGQLAEQMLFRIGDRTVLSYEHGTRRLSVPRFLEVCWALGADAAILLTRALQRARIQVQTMVLHLDLRELHRDSSRNDKFRPIAQWAQNALNEHPSGVMPVEPTVVRNLALFMGCQYLDLANYLARFTPDDNNADDGH
jgi:transcriptional regulator with XRE-family HTH domain